MTSGIFIEYQSILAQLVHTTGWVGIWVYNVAHIAVWFNTIIAIWFEMIWWFIWLETAEILWVCAFPIISVGNWYTNYGRRCRKTLRARNFCVGNINIYKWYRFAQFFNHYDDVIMTMLASQMTSLTVVYSIAYSGVNQRKHQSSASLAFVGEIHREPVNFPHKWPVTRKMFPFDDVIMIPGCGRFY